MELYALMNILSIIFPIIGVIILVTCLLKIYFKSSNRHVHKTANRLYSLQKYDVDLVIFTTHYPTCGECSKYQGRVFSISGKDKRFPKLPDFIRETGVVHEKCKHVLVPYIYDLQSVSENRKNIAFSNRPFVDSRSQEEIQLYDTQQHNDYVWQYDNDNYQELIKKIPDVAPKSYSAFRRMKNSNTANYQKLVSIAKTYGINIDEYRQIKVSTPETQAPTNEFISMPQNNTYKTCEEISFESEMRIVEDCERLVVETKNLEVFISRYKLLYEKLQFFMSEYGHSPDRLEYNESLFSQRLIDCVDRIVADAEKLKTDKGRSNRIEKLEAYLQDCYDKETDDVFKEGLYYNLDRVKIIKCNMLYIF